MHVKFLLPAALLLTGAFVLPSRAAFRPVISEFMASNDKTLEDEDGRSSDWIEIYNSGGSHGNLEGWCLTDSAGNLAKWVFPSIPLPPDSYLIVFASGKNRSRVGHEPHTNFKLSAGGEYLALVKPDRTTVVSEYSPEYPVQLLNVSYGLTMTTESSAFVTTNTPARVLVPENDNLGLSWSLPEFTPVDWLNTTASIGFDIGATPLPELVAHWPLDEAAGVSEISDVSGNQHHGYATAGVILGASGATNTTSTAVTFSNGALNIPFDIALNPADITLSVWAYPTSASGAYRSVITSRHSLAGNYEGYMLYIDPSDKWQFWTGSGSSWHQLDGPDALMDRWTHIALCFDSATNTKSIYVNGALFTSVTTQRYLPNSSQPLHIGSGGDSGSQYHFHGTIDDVALFNTTLEATLIQTIMANSMPESGLIDYREIIKTDLEAEMRAINSSVYLRVPFTAATTNSLAKMTLKMKYDDGFIAYLNGTRVASRNAPLSPQHNSSATKRNPDRSAERYEDIDISAWLSSLRSGDNVLAIHGLNFAPANEDFLIVPRLSVSTAATFDTTRAGYFSEPTPAQENSAATSILGPFITAATHFPSEPLATENLIVSAQVSQSFHPISAVTLHYRSMYNPESTLTMSDNGGDGDAVAGDGTYSAIIPAGAAAAGEMLRYHIKAEDTHANTTRAPLITDTEGSAQSPKYYGTRVQNGAVTSQLPIFHWWTQNYAASQTRAGTRCCVFYGGEFYDNVFARQRGQASNGRSQKFVFGKSHRLYVNSELGRVREINMNAQGADPTYARQSLAFQLFTEVGLPSCESFLTLMRVNGGFDRVAVLIEQVDDNFIKRHDLDQYGALYKCVQKSNLNPSLSEQPDGIEKKLPRDDHDFTDLQKLIDGLNLTLEDDRRRFLFDNFNIPEVVNYLAARSLTQDCDEMRKNFYIFCDSNNSAEWRILPWDKDYTFGITGDASAYATHPKLGDSNHPKGIYRQWGKLHDLFLTMPETEDMFRRRTRSLMDTYLLPPQTPAGSSWLEQRATQIFTAAEPHLHSSAASGFNELLNYFPAKRANLYVTHHASHLPDDVAGIPDQQPADTVIEFGAYEISPASGNQDEEYIELLNHNTCAVDISGWSAQGGITLTFEPGTVIPAGKVLYISPSVKTFRQRGSSPSGGESRFVVGNYSGHLSELGENLTLKDQNGRVVDTLSYSGTASDAQRNLRITEIMYHPRLPESGDTPERDFEYIEIKNIGSSAQDLTGVHFDDGIRFRFESGNLAPGALAVIVRTPAVFATRYNTNSIYVCAPYEGSLSNSGEKITLKDSLEQTIASFTYGDGRGWPLAADGAGHALVPTVDGGVEGTQLNYPGNWRAGTYRDGSPGLDDPPPFDTVLLNEFAANTAYSNPAHPEYDSNDWLEIFNITPATLSLDHWYLSDDADDLKQFAIPSSTTLPGGGWLMFDEVTGFNNPLGSGFGLKKSGEQLYLSYLPGTAADRVADAISFEAQENGVTLSRFPDGGAFWFATTPTPSAANRRPVPEVVISKVMYHPAPAPNGAPDNTTHEYIELFNATESDVPLGSAEYPWRISGTVSITFPVATTIAAKERITIVAFNPQTNLTARQAFIATHGMTNSCVTLTGPFTDTLDHNSGRITLKKPRQPDTPGGSVSWVIVDEVIYSDSSPWPQGASGGGLPIERILADHSGCDPSNWRAGGTLSSPRDMDLDGLPDLWEITWFGGTHASPYEDSDADGICNLDEYIAGTAPTDETSFFAIHINRAENTPVVEFHALATSTPAYEGLSRLYTLESTTSLRQLSWRPIPGYTEITGSDQIIKYSVLTNRAEFFRARAWLQD